MDALRTLKFRLAEWIKKSPRAWYWTVSSINSLPFLLPHEKSYFGLAHLVDKECTDGTILDVGANNGMSAMGFRAVGVPYRIVSIEANPAHEPALRRVKRKLRNFEYRILAGGKTESEFTLHIPFYKGVPLHALASFDLEYAKKAASRDFTPHVAKQIHFVTKQVDVLPLDRLNLKPNIIKVDVEGHDYEVLLGLRTTIETCRPHLLIEYTPGNFEPISTFLKGLSYGLYRYDERSNRFVRWNEDVASASHSSCGLQVNIFAIPTEAIPTIAAVTTPVAAII
jgi:FkbM family methyltransferase